MEEVICTLGNGDENLQVDLERRTLVTVTGIDDGLSLLEEEALVLPYPMGNGANRDGAFTGVPVIPLRGLRLPAKEPPPAPPQG